MTYKTSITTGMCRKIWNWSKIIIFTVIFPIVLLLTSLEYFSYDSSYFRNYQIKNEITQSTGRSQEELNRVSRDLIDYLKHGDSNLLTRHFNDREVTHMKDVYRLYAGGRLLRNILAGVALLLFISFLMDKQRTLLFHRVAKSLTFWWVLLIALGIGVLVDFNRIFILFHHLFFDNNLWILNPETDWMIRLLPESFFLGIVLRTLVLFLILLAISHIGFAMLGREKTYESCKKH